MYLQPTQISNVTNSTFWKDLLLRYELLNALKIMGFEYPSPIQVKAIPKIIQGHNVILQAKAGTGKTAVFALSILNKMRPEVNGEYLPHQCLVIAKTRQLAYQICQEFLKFSQCMEHPKVRVNCFFGGLSVVDDLEVLASFHTPHIIVGTPGRLKDLFERGFINHKNIRYLVIDECDEVLMRKGLKTDVDYLYRIIRPQIQYIMVSATYTEQTLQMCRTFSKQFVQVFMNDGYLDFSSLVQFYELVRQQHKLELLSRLLDFTPFSQAIIFTNTVQKTMEVTQLLTNNLFNPITIHSDLSQEERLECYQKFRQNGSRVLVATDLFGRGIDIEQVNFIVNYDVPREVNTYIHRVGRAGRFNTKGVVVNFVNDAKKNEEVVILSQSSQTMNCLINKLPQFVPLEQFL